MMTSQFPDLSEKYAFEKTPSRFDTEEFHRLLIFLSKIGASDLKVQSSNCLIAKVHGDIHFLTSRILPHTEVESIVNVLYGPNGSTVIKAGKIIDKAYDLHPKPDRYRFRINVMPGLVNGSNGIEITIRMVALEPPDMDEIGIEEKLRAGAFHKDGIFIMSGPTGGGKSTTLGSFIKHILKQPDSNKFVVTHEQPIEFVYDTIFKPKSTIFQTEVGPDGHVKTFAEAIRAAMRRAPDVILNGEMRDMETIEATMAAAQSGHAVYTTVHADSVAQTFSRVVNFFPYSARASMMNSMVSNVRGICYQKLIKTVDGRRAALREFLIFTEEIREELLSIGSDNTDKMILQVKKLVEREGQTISMCAQNLFEQGKIDEHALIAATC